MSSKLYTPVRIKRYVLVGVIMATVVTGLSYTIAYLITDTEVNNENKFTWDFSTSKTLSLQMEDRLADLLYVRVSVRILELNDNKESIMKGFPALYNDIYKFEIYLLLEDLQENERIRVDGDLW
ncbi:MAG: hypothetical protein ACXAD7_14725, partial [Candidatus Kariarchaeaceae archaeon]